VKRFLRAVVREGNPQDEIKLFTFNYEVVERTGFTRRMELVEKALGNVRAEAGTSLYDAIHFGSKALESRQGRHVLVIVTDGGDTTSAYKYQQALEAAHLADAPVYSILVMPITNDAGRNIGGENALYTLGTSTGGRVFTPAVGPQLDSAFDDILRDLRTQYLLGFYPRDVPKTKNPYHKIEVKLNAPDLRVETRSGYYGEAEP
jgi:Ca-activated chloride channel family protein